jgi:prolyl-tRNA editing enzyme YbaK/EbsC (Cys-tRNA(Pro) deacylase)
MVEELSRSARRVQEVLASSGMDTEVIELPASTRTAAEAASAIGCSIAQIAKTILFRTVKRRNPIIVVASGVNRINEATIETQIGEPIEKADAAYVRERTGFAIGGVPPVGHLEPIYTIVDEDLLELGNIWAAAGTPNAVFHLTGKALLEMTNGVLMPIK